MHINDFPYEVLSQILDEVTKANVRDGPTYTFGLQQAPLPLERAKLQRYVRGPVPPELLKWDATATLRSVCWKWHEWSLEHSIKDVYIRRWKGGEVSTTHIYQLDITLTSGKAMGRTLQQTRELPALRAHSSPDWHGRLP